MSDEPDLETEIESATNLAVTLGWVAGAVAIAYVLGIVLSWVVRRIGGRSDLIRDLSSLTRAPVRATLMVIGAFIAVNRTADEEERWRGWVDQLLLIVLIATLAWLAIRVILVLERRFMKRYGGGDTELPEADRHRRRMRTQIVVLRRLAIAIVVILAVAAALMTFPTFADLGATLFASAGVMSIVAGLAAQTSLGAVFAGMQIAFSDAIRVGDVVVVEGEWGRIEEITLTYVVVQVWDDRRLVLPSTYFTTKPFENWTRRQTELLGTVELSVDFSVPIAEMRAELDRQLAATDLWDGRVGGLSVTEATGSSMTVRVLVSAQDSGLLWDLRVTIREGMVTWLQQFDRGGLPRLRIETSSESERNARDAKAARRSAPVPGEGENAPRGPGLFAGEDGDEDRRAMFAGPGDEVLAERARQDEARGEQSAADEEWERMRRRGPEGEG
ncbi:mechanosensitive ion channel family protein [Serinibacter salmoneus]|uniref:Small-conductance mechanosensitive channel n=1 Tax=Serinibacter salmoneus TaxID=556530 RepID=A0A2A9D4K9_9MICO|nr:mechanosensitive ion channel family protein [Serinibacter salmoneus]PFG21321.1 small-conductance mechanosensitive channel [Serinibacter salmoneus]